MSFTPPPLPYDLSRLRDIPPEKVQAANEVLAILFGAEFNPMMLESVVRDSVSDAADLYEASLEADAEGHQEEEES